MRISILFLSLILRGRESLAAGKKEKEHNSKKLIVNQIDKLLAFTGKNHSIIGYDNKDNLKRSLTTDNWLQLGQTIAGEAYLDLSGKDLALSDDGTIVAIGAVDNDGGGLVDDNQGHVRVFEYSEGNQSWKQIGGDIDGIIPEDKFGFALSLSGNGKSVAVGVPFHDRTGQRDIGRVRLLDYNGIDWIQRGTYIIGEAKQDTSGYSVSINYDGSSVAIGAPGHDKNGYARVFEWEGTDWQQRENDIDGEA